MNIRKTLSKILALALSFALILPGALPQVLAVEEAETWDGAVDTSWVNDYSAKSTFTISTAAELAGLAQIVNEDPYTRNFSGKTINLIEDINLTGHEWMPIGTEYCSFQGTFNGNGYTITGLTMTDQTNKYQGLFGRISNAKVINLSVMDIAIKTDNAITMVGGITGFMDFSTISGCFTSGVMTLGGNYTVAGGIGGFISNGNSSSPLTIENCFSSVEIYTSGIDARLGGIAGQASSAATIRNCYASGDIKATGERSNGSFIGGIVGEADYSDTLIENCIAMNRVEGKECYAGGIVGTTSLNAKIKGCVALNPEIVTDWPNTPCMGRIVGDDRLCILEDNHAWEYVELIGHYPMLGEKASASSITTADLIEGRWPSAFLADPWEMQESGMPKLIGLAGQSASLPLHINPFPEGKGTAASPYILDTEEQLYSLSDYKKYSFFYSKHFLLNSDLDLSDYKSGESWPQIGNGNGVFDEGSQNWIYDTYAFTGSFDGGEHTIENLFYDGDIYEYGLFGLIKGGTVKNLHLSGVDITAIGNVGGICGRITGEGAKIVGCSVSGQVTASNGVAGGIAAVVEQGALVENCSTSGNVDGSFYVGGIAGSISAATVQNSFNSADVHGESNCVGGITGLAEATSIVENCYNTGAISAEGVNGFDESGVGGIVGLLRASTTRRSFNAGDVTGKTGGAGGIVAWLNNDNSGAPTVFGLVEDCYNIGEVSGTWSVGGIAGQVRGTLSRSYSTGEVTASSRNTGGIVGRMPAFGRIENCIALNPSVTGKDWGVDSTNSSYLGGRVLGFLDGGSLSANSAWVGMTGSNDGVSVSWKRIGANSNDGISLSALAISKAEAWSEFSETNGWIYTVGKLPILAGIPAEAQSNAIPSYIPAPVVSGLNANPATLTASGGESQITVSGANLFDSLKVSAFDSAGATSITATTSGDADSQAASLNFPANISISEDKEYTIKVSLDNSTTWEVATTTVTVIKAAATYTADIDPASKIFAAATMGYDTQPAQVFTITNTGSGQITGLDASLGGTSFEISTALSATTVNASGTVTISVRPKTGLSAGSHTDTLSITGDNGLSLTAALSFAVNEVPAYNVTVTGGIGGGSFAEGAEVTVRANTPPSGQQFKEWTATGLDATDLVSSDLAANPLSFTMPDNDVALSATYEDAPATVSSVVVSPSNIEVQAGTSQQFGATVSGTNNPPQTVTWTVEGNNSNDTAITGEGLLSVAADEIAASLIITATSAHDTDKFDTVTVTVTAEQPVSVYDISLSIGGVHNFGERTVGYASDSVAAYAVTITNTGNQATDALQLAISGDDFNLSVASISSIDVGNTANFTVVPNHGLDVGSYTATVTVSGANEISASFDVHFTVSAAIYDVTVTSGTGGGSYSEGAEVTVHANTPPSGQQFKEWAATGVSGLDLSVDPLSFDMPGNDVALIALYEIIPVTVSTVSVSPDLVAMNKGTTQKFNATVNGMNNPPQTVTWKVEGNNNGGTVIDSSGLLTVDANETATSLTVTATSKHDTSKSGTAAVTVTQPTITNAQTPNISTHPQGGSVYTSSSITLAVTATSPDGGKLSYQWYSNTTNSTTDGTAISGATASEYAPSTSRAGTTYYYVVVTNTNATVNGTQTAALTSNVATVVVNNRSTGGGTTSGGSTGSGSSSGNSTTSPSTTTSTTPADSSGTTSSGTTPAPDQSGTPTPPTDQTTTPPPTPPTDVQGNTVTTAEDNPPVTDANGNTSLPGGGDIETGNGVSIVAPPGTIIDTEGTIHIPADESAETTLPGGMQINLPGDTTIDKNGGVTLGGAAQINLPGEKQLSVPVGSTISENGTLTVGSGGATLSFGDTTLFIAEGTIIIFDEATPLGYFASFTNPFSDVQKSDWYYDSVIFAYSHGLFSGTGTDPMTFSPGASMTRAMFVTVLSRLNGEELSGNAASPFGDVHADQWYAPAITWAAEQGIVGGVAEGLFDPDAPITREQMAVMLFNYMAYKGYAGVFTEVSAFADEESISAWALEAVLEIQKMGIISGRPGDLFDPQSLATRAEVAAIFARFAEYIASIRG